MSNRLGLGGSLSARFHSTNSVEQLEQRTLMTAAPGLPAGAADLNWGGSHMVVKPGSYVLTFDDALGSQQAELVAREAATRLGVSGTDFQSIGQGRYASFTATGTITKVAADRLAQSLPHLKYFEPNQLYQIDAVPNDPRFGDEWWLTNTGQFIPGSGLGTIGADIHAQQAWDQFTIGSRSVIVADIDTGLDLTHPDIVPNLWTNPGEIAGDGLDNDGNGFIDDVHGYDFGDQDGNPQDDSNGGGHGTETAGVIGAAGNNNLGITGVNWNVSIMALKIADQFGRLSTAAIIGAHDYATMMRGRGFNIVASNNSYGAYQPQFYANAPQGISGERDAIQRFINSGATFVAAAGNASRNNDDPNVTNFPSSYNIPGVISVAASDNNDALANFSSYGAHTVNLAAPGVNVLTTQRGGGYGFVDGTSFSSPAVAGAVALIKAYKPNASAVEIREALINSADRLPAFEGKVESGGRLNVFRALQMISVDGPLIRSVVPGPVVGQINPGTNQPFNTVTILFSKDIDPASLSPSAVSLLGSGPDHVFGTGDDRVIPITTVTRATDPRTVVIGLNLISFPQQRLPVDSYRLVLTASGFRDVNGNFLGGNSVSGVDQTYNFRVVGATGDNEPNDTLAEATPISFTASGQATFTGVTLGNGVASNLDVDLYRVDMARGGEITAEITAKRLPAPSSLDSYLRLFDASGNQIAANDQTFAQDAFIDFFVNTGGTYYVGVSGFGNANYNPNLAGSGTSQSTGVYNLRVAVALQTDDVITTNSTDPNLPRRVPVAEGQTQGTTTSIITISDTRQVLDVNVKFDITHTFDADLRISLISPTGIEVLLVNGRGANGDNFTNTILDDEAATSITTASAPFTGVFRPEGAMGSFDGHNAAGNWTLRVQDTTPLNSGFLNSWSLTFTFKNDIFGPFEANDTLATAKLLAEINGTGNATRAAFIGDGGFGNFDRDLFSFNAAAGSTLNLFVSSGGVANTAVRLFDSSGTQILVSSPDGTLNTAIQNYTFANGGLYYIGISDANNLNYNPQGVGTGTASATTGAYSFTLTLAAGVSDPNLVLDGNSVAVGVNNGGTFAAPSGSGANVGLVFNGVEFLPVTGAPLPRPQMFCGAAANGFNFSNSGPVGTNDLPFSLNSSSDTFNKRVATDATFRGLKIERTFSFGVNDSFVAIDVYFTNTTASVISNLSWMDGFNPDPGVTLGDANKATINDVDATGHMATARYFNNAFPGGLTVGLAAASGDTRAKATVLDASVTVRDPSVLVGQAANDPDNTSNDSTLALSYDMGNINAGATASIRYFIFFGTTPAPVDNLYAQVNNGTGTGHLTADPAHPAAEALVTGSGPATSVPSLPYKVYYPEGFFGDNIYTFVPISNISNEPANVYVIAHYETGNRDQLVGQLTIGANARSGLTITNPTLFHSGGALAGRPNAPYALEVRSDRPVAATFSHYDLALLAGHSAAIGESFTSQVSSNWTFGQVSKGNGNVDFIVFFNPNPTTTVVTANFYPFGGGTPIQASFQLEGMRRGGLSINDIATIPSGDYGVVLTSAVPIVASLSHYNFVENNAAGSVGDVGTGSVTGVIPEGQFGVNSTHDTLGVLNSSSTAATVVFSFLFQNGSAYRTSLAVPAGTHRTLEVASLPNFPTGQPYGVFYESNTPVTFSAISRAFGDAESTASTSQAFSHWGFGEGYRPGDNDHHPGVVENLRLYNPTEADVTVEITIGYDGIPGSETFRRVLPARRITEFNTDQFITGSRRLSQQWYGTDIKASAPIVAYMLHDDKAFLGAFGTLGTPFGLTTPVT